MKPIYFEDYVTLKLVCPHCLYEMDRSMGTTITAEEMRPPKAGDISICIACGSVNIYDAHLQLQMVSAEELTTIREEDPSIWTMIQEMQQMLKNPQ